MTTTMAKPRTETPTVERLLEAYSSGTLDEVPIEDLAEGLAEIDAESTRADAEYVEVAIEALGERLRENDRRMTHCYDLHAEGLMGDAELNAHVDATDTENRILQDQYDRARRVFNARGQ